MNWIKLANNFPSHPKVLMAGVDGGWLFVCSLCYANEHLTDGYIPAGALPLLAPGLKRPEKAANRLVDVGLWERTEIGWQVHDYTEWQRTSEQIRNGLRADRERKRLGIRPESDGIPGAARARARAGARAGAREEGERERETPPVVPPKGGRQRDRIRWENNVDAWAGEYFPQLPRDVRFHAVRQAFKWGKAESVAQVTEYIRENFPDVAHLLEASS